MSFLNNLFGTSVSAPTVTAPNLNFAGPAGFSGGGLSSTFSGNTTSVAPSADRNAAVSGVSSTFGQQASALGNLASQFTPGFSNMRQAQLTALNNNRTQALGNLRDNLAQRRVLGSSFAQNSLASADENYQNQISQTLAQSYLQEVSTQQQLIQQQYTAARGQFQTNLNEMNLEAGVASSLSSQATSAMLSASTTQAQLDLQASTTNAYNNLSAQTTNANNTMKTLGGLGSLIGFGLTGGIGGLGGTGFLSPGSTIPASFGATSVGGAAGPTPLNY